jgi:hypothetical protein
MPFTLKGEKGDRQKIEIHSAGQCNYAALIESAVFLLAGTGPTRIFISPGEMVYPWRALNGNQSPFSISQTLRLLIVILSPILSPLQEILFIQITIFPRFTKIILQIFLRYETGDLIHHCIVSVV